MDDTRKGRKIHMSDREHAGLVDLADRWGVSLSEAVRVAVASAFQREDLWAVYVNGSDDVLSARDYASAKKAADEVSLLDSEDVPCFGEVIQWPFDACSHADSIDNDAAVDGGQPQANAGPAAWGEVIQLTRREIADELMGIAGKIDKALRTGADSSNESP